MAMETIANKTRRINFFIIFKFKERLEKS